MDSEFEETLMRQIVMIGEALAHISEGLMTMNDAAEIDKRETTERLEQIGVSLLKLANPILRVDPDK